MQANALDETAIRQFIDDIGPAAKELIGHFVTDIRDKISELSHIPDTADITSLTIHAHSLKGLSRSCGMVGMSDVAYELETACRENNRDRAATHFSDVQKHAEPAIKALISFVDKNA